METQSLCESTKSKEDDYSLPSIEVVNLECSRLITASPNSGNRIAPLDEENTGDGYWQ